MICRTIWSPEVRQGAKAKPTPKDCSAIPGRCPSRSTAVTFNYRKPDQDSCEGATVTITYTATGSSPRAPGGLRPARPAC